MLHKNGKVHHTPLAWCPDCNEHSVVRRFYNRKHDNKHERIEICMNKGCGYKAVLPFAQVNQEAII